MKLNFEAKLLRKFLTCDVTFLPYPLAYKRHRFVSVTKLTSSGRLELKRHIYCDNIILVENTSDRDKVTMSFKLYLRDHSGHSVIFIAPNAEEKMKWISAFKEGF